MEGCLLHYYKKPTSQFPTGTIYFGNTNKIDCLLESFENHPNCFVVDTPNRCFYISAESAKEMYDWVVALRCAKSQLVSNSNGKMASQIDVQEVPSRMSIGINLQKRKQNGKTFVNCFTGTNGIDWMMLYLSLESRSECIVVGNRLLQEGFIQNLTTPSYVDEPTAYYHFLKTQ